MDYKSSFLSKEQLAHSHNLNPDDFESKKDVEEEIKFRLREEITGIKRIKVKEIN